jgi:hypothetical protein
MSDYDQRALELKEQQNVAYIRALLQTNSMLSAQQSAQQQLLISSLVQSIEFNVSQPLSLKRQLSGGVERDGARAVFRAAPDDASDEAPEDAQKIPLPRRVELLEDLKVALDKLVGAAADEAFLVRELERLKDLSLTLL